MKTVALAVLFFVSSIAYGASVEALVPLKDISVSQEWLALLHYPKAWRAGLSSEVSGGDFFLSPEGKKNPLAELEATLKAMNQDLQLGPFKLHPLCVFRARYKFLSQKLNLQIPARPCEKWDGFLERFHGPTAVSLIFSSAYTNNPASMFGHLFLKVRSSRSSDLLDVGINFAAQVPADENPFAFFYFGVFGGYKGSWSVQSYYEKLNEYVKSENRDLWEYELNLTSDETLFLLEHLWELETTGIIYYYFFDENCAYQVMRLLEVVKPRWNLSDHKIYVIPGEILKNLYRDQDVVREVKFRPSLRKKLFQKYDVLEPGQKKNLLSVIRQEGSPQALKDSLTLETLSAYYDFQRQLKKGKLSEKEKENWDQTLQERAALGIGSGTRLPEISAETRPDLGHDAYALIPLVGFEDAGVGRLDSYQGFRIKSAYHDLLNRDLGFKRYSEIQFPWVEIRYRPELHNFNVEEVGGVKITSLVPLSVLDFNPSWKVSLGWASPKYTGCLTCRFFVWEGGLGLSYEVGSYRHMFFQFLTMKAEFDQSLVHGSRLLPSYEMGWLTTLNDDWKVKLQAGYSKNLQDEPDLGEFFQVEGSQSFSLKRNLEFRQGVQWIYKSVATRPTYAELRFDLAYYFR